MSSSDTRGWKHGRRFGRGQGFKNGVSERVRQRVCLNRLQFQQSQEVFMGCLSTALDNRYTYTYFAGGSAKLSALQVYCGSMVGSFSVSMSDATCTCVLRMPFSDCRLWYVHICLFRAWSWTREAGGERARLRCVLCSRKGGCMFMPARSSSPHGNMGTRCLLLHRRQCKQCPPEV